MISLVNCKTPVEPSHLINQVLQETHEREKCSSNILVYGIPESYVSSITQRILDNNFAFSNIMSKLNLTTPSNLKMMRLGKSNPDSVCLLKIFCENKEFFMKILSDYRSSKEEFIKFFKKFKIVTKHPFSENYFLALLYIFISTYFDNRIKNDESNLKISYANKIPRIIFSI